jgi:GxxExxY protein
MNADKHRWSLDQLTRKIIGGIYRVSNSLGIGFLEKVYENALVIELRHRGLLVEQQHPLKVFYRDLPVGEYSTDLLVEGRVVVELKAARALDQAHAAQCMNYLRAAGLNVCLLVNFGTPRAQIKRIVSNFHSPNQDTESEKIGVHPRSSASLSTLEPGAKSL